MVPAKNSAPVPNRQKQDLIQRLQMETSRHFLERSAGEINDALTSILGVTDAEAPATVPKIKKYIQRINQSLQSLKIYQAAIHQKNTFNVQSVLVNVLDVLESNFKDGIALSRSIADMPVEAEGDPAALERLLLNFFIELIEVGKAQKGSVLVKLGQKNHDAVINIKQDQMELGDALSMEVEAMKKDFHGKIEIMPYGSGTEITIRIPLLFSHKAPDFAPPHEISLVSLEPPRLKRPTLA